MYSSRSGLVLGFHGCDLEIAEEVLAGSKSLRKSENKYDWLGHGIYFWENSPARAKEFASHLSQNSKKATHPIKNPAVVGAVLDLGYCLDLLDFENLQLLKESYNILGHNPPISTHKSISFLANCQLVTLFFEFLGYYIPVYQPFYFEI